MNIVLAFSIVTIGMEFDIRCCPEGMSHHATVNRVAALYRLCRWDHATRHASLTSCIASLDAYAGSSVTSGSDEQCVPRSLLKEGRRSSTSYFHDANGCAGGSSWLCSEDGSSSCSADLNQLEATICTAGKSDVDCDDIKSFLAAVIFDPHSNSGNEGRVGATDNKKELFSNSSIWILGRRGVGKSTLLTGLCQTWAQQNVVGSFIEQSDSGLSSRSQSHYDVALLSTPLRSLSCWSPLASWQSSATSGGGADDAQTFQTLRCNSSRVPSQCGDASSAATRGGVGVTKGRLFVYVPSNVLVEVVGSSLQCGVASSAVGDVNVRPDGGDVDPLHWQFAALIASALNDTVRARLPVGICEAVAPFAPKEVLQAIVVTPFEFRKRNVLLLLDDAHHITGSAPQAFLRQLLHWFPTHVVVVNSDEASSRTMPPIVPPLGGQWWMFDVKGLSARTTRFAAAHAFFPMHPRMHTLMEAYANNPRACRLLTACSSAARQRAGCPSNAVRTDCFSVCSSPSAACTADQVASSPSSYLCAPLLLALMGLHQSSKAHVGTTAGDATTTDGAILDGWCGRCLDAIEQWMPDASVDARKHHEHGDMMVAMMPVDVAPRGPGESTTTLPACLTEFLCCGLAIQRTAAVVLVPQPFVAACAAWKIISLCHGANMLWTGPTERHDAATTTTTCSMHAMLRKSWTTPVGQAVWRMLLELSASCRCCTQDQHGDGGINTNCCPLLRDVISVGLYGAPGTVDLGRDGALARSVQILHVLHLASGEDSNISSAFAGQLTTASAAAAVETLSSSPRIPFDLHAPPAYVLGDPNTFVGSVVMLPTAVLERWLSRLATPHDKTLHQSVVVVGIKRWCLLHCAAVPISPSFAHAWSQILQELFDLVDVVPASCSCASSDESCDDDEAMLQTAVDDLAHLLDVLSAHVAVVGSGASLIVEAALLPLAHRLSLRCIGGNDFAASSMVVGSQQPTMIGCGSATGAPHATMLRRFVCGIANCLGAVHAYEARSSSSEAVVGHLASLLLLTQGASLMDAAKLLVAMPSSVAALVVTTMLPNKSTEPLLHQLVAALVGAPVNDACCVPWEEPQPAVAAECNDALPFPSVAYGCGLNGNDDTTTAATQLLVECLTHVITGMHALSTTTAASCHSLAESLTTASAPTAGEPCAATMDVHIHMPLEAISLLVHRVMDGLLTVCHTTAANHSTEARTLMPPSYLWHCMIACVRYDNTCVELVGKGVAERTTTSQSVPSSNDSASKHFGRNFWASRQRKRMVAVFQWWEAVVHQTLLVQGGGRQRSTGSLDAADEAPPAPASYSWEQWTADTFVLQAWCASGWDGCDARTRRRALHEVRAAFTASLLGPLLRSLNPMIRGMFACRLMALPRSLGSSACAVLLSRNDELFSSSLAPHLRRCLLSALQKESSIGTQRHIHALLLRCAEGSTFESRSRVASVLCLRQKPSIPLSKKAHPMRSHLSLCKHHRPVFFMHSVDGEVVSRLIEPSIWSLIWEAAAADPLCDEHSSSSFALCSRCQWHALLPMLTDAVVQNSGHGSAQVCRLLELPSTAWQRLVGHSSSLLHNEDGGGVAHWLLYNILPHCTVHQSMQMAASIVIGKHLPLPEMLACLQSWVSSATTTRTPSGDDRGLDHLSSSTKRTPPPVGSLRYVGVYFFIALCHHYNSSDDTHTAAAAYVSDAANAMRSWMMQAGTEAAANMNSNRSDTESALQLLERIVVSTAAQLAVMCSERTTDSVATHPMDIENVGKCTQPSFPAPPDGLLALYRFLKQGAASSATCYRAVGVNVLLLSTILTVWPFPRWEALDEESSAHDELVCGIDPEGTGHQTLQRAFCPMERVVEHATHALKSSRFNDNEEEGSPHRDSTNGNAHRGKVTSPSAGGGAASCFCGAMVVRALSTCALFAGRSTHGDATYATAVRMLLTSIVAGQNDPVRQSRRHRQLMLRVLCNILTNYNDSLARAMTLVLPLTPQFSVNAVQELASLCLQDRSVRMRWHGCQLLGALHDVRPSAILPINEGGSFVLSMPNVLILAFLRDRHISVKREAALSLFRACGSDVTALLRILDVVVVPHITELLPGYCHSENWVGVAGFFSIYADVLDHFSTRCASPSPAGNHDDVKNAVPITHATKSAVLENRIAVASRDALLFVSRFHREHLTIAVAGTSEGEGNRADVHRRPVPPFLRCRDLAVSLCRLLHRAQTTWVGMRSGFSGGGSAPDHDALTDARSPLGALLAHRCWYWILQCVVHHYVGTSGDGATTSTESPSLNAVIESSTHHILVALKWATLGCYAHPGIRLSGNCVDELDGLLADLSGLLLKLKDGSRQQQACAEAWATAYMAWLHHMSSCNRRGFEDSSSAASELSAVSQSASAVAADHRFAIRRLRTVLGLPDIPCASAGAIHPKVRKPRLLSLSVYEHIIQVLIEPHNTMLVPAALQESLRAVLVDAVIASQVAAQQQQLLLATSATTSVLQPSGGHWLLKSLLTLSCASATLPKDHSCCSCQSKAIAQLLSWVRAFCRTPEEQQQVGGGVLHQHVVQHKAATLVSCGDPLSRRFARHATVLFLSLCDPCLMRPSATRGNVPAACGGCAMERPHVHCLFVGTAVQCMTDLCAGSGGNASYRQADPVELNVRSWCLDVLQGVTDAPTTSGDGMRRDLMAALCSRATTPPKPHATTQQIRCTFQRPVAIVSPALLPTKMELLRWCRDHVAGIATRLSLARSAQRDAVATPPPLETFEQGAELLYNMAQEARAVTIPHLLLEEQQPGAGGHCDDGRPECAPWTIDGLSLPPLLVNVGGTFLLAGMSVRDPAEQCSGDRRDNNLPLLIRWATWHVAVMDVLIKGASANRRLAMSSGAVPPLERSPSMPTVAPRRFLVQQLLDNASGCTEAGDCSSGGQAQLITIWMLRAAAKKLEDEAGTIQSEPDTALPSGEGGPSSPSLVVVEIDTACVCSGGPLLVFWWFDAQQRSIPGPPSSTAMGAQWVKTPKDANALRRHIAAEVLWPFEFDDPHDHSGMATYQLGATTLARSGTNDTDLAALCGIFRSASDSSVGSVGFPWSLFVSTFLAGCGSIAWRDDLEIGPSDFLELGETVSDYTSMPARFGVMCAFYALSKRLQKMPLLQLQRRNKSGAAASPTPSCAPPADAPLTYCNFHAELHRSLRSHLHATYTASVVIASGCVANGSVGSIGKLGTVLGALGSSVPLVGGALGLLGSILQAVDNLSEKQKLENIRQLAVSEWDAAVLFSDIARRVLAVDYLDDTALCEDSVDRWVNTGTELVNSAVQRISGVTSVRGSILGDAQAREAHSTAVRHGRLLANIVLQWCASGEPYQQACAAHQSSDTTVGARCAAHVNRYLKQLHDAAAADEAIKATAATDSVDGGTNPSSLMEDNKAPVGVKSSVCCHQ